MLTRYTVVAYLPGGRTEAYAIEAVTPDDARKACAELAPTATRFAIR